MALWVPRFGACLGFFAYFVAMAAAGWMKGVKEVFQGVCYTPYPTRAGPDGPHATQDDYMSEAAKPLWGPHGRSDLLTIKALGANRVRLYGNNPENDHKTFLDYADSIGMKAIVGLSNWPYNQMPGNCNSTGLDCFNVIKEFYKGNLLRGFVTPQGEYHPALSHLIVMNEPELQLAHPATAPYIDENGTNVDPKDWMKGILSAIDGILEAEKEQNITGDLLAMTVTFTYAKCHQCIGQSRRRHDRVARPGLGQMLDLKQALLHPEAYGYKPRNDLAYVFHNRFLNSMNTKNPFPDLKEQFLDDYERVFPDTSLLFEEYHSFWQWGYQAHLEDLNACLDYARKSPVFLGFNFFEFQISWPKASNFEELLFGIFGIGTYTITEMDYFGLWTEVNCLQEVTFSHWAAEAGTATGLSAFLPSSNMTDAVTHAFKGKGVDAAALCRPDPAKVPLTAGGYMAVKYLPNCIAGMMTFVQRIIERLGGMTIQNRGLKSFCQKYCSASGFSSSTISVGRRLDLTVPDLESQGQYDDLIYELRLHPGWAWWSLYATCVADRGSNTYLVGRTVDHVCKNELKYFDCVNVPWHCQTNPWLTADYVLSTQFNELESRGDPNPLQGCYFNGTAIYASSTYQYEEYMDTTCIVSKDPAATPLDDQGYAAIQRTESPRGVRIFMKRRMEQLWNATVCSLESFRRFSDKPPRSMYELDRDMKAQYWICGGLTEKPCEPCQEQEEANILKNFWFQVVLYCTLVLLCITTCMTCWYARTLPEESEEWAHKYQKQYSKYAGSEPAE